MNSGSNPSHKRLNVFAKVCKLSKLVQNIDMTSPEGPGPDTLSQLDPDRMKAALESLLPVTELTEQGAAHMGRYLMLEATYAETPESSEQNP